MDVVKFRDQIVVLYISRMDLLPCEFFKDEHVVFYSLIKVLK